jgi:transposase
MQLLRKIHQMMNVLRLRKLILKLATNHLSAKQEAVDLLVTLPGVNYQAASIILAEIGTDMSQFKSDGHLAAWAGLSPGNHESAGKKTAKSTVWEQYLEGYSV